jgi:hypothetical protein
MSSISFPSVHPLPFDDSLDESQAAELAFRQIDLECELARYHFDQLAFPAGSASYADLEGKKIAALQGRNHVIGLIRAIKYPSWPLEFDVSEIVSTWADLDGVSGNHQSVKKSLAAWLAQRPAST